MTDAGLFGVGGLIAERCPWAIKWGVTLHTRCMLAPDHTSNGGMHQGRGLEQFSYQRIEWLPGDRREYQSSRTDEYCWEE